MFKTIEGINLRTINFQESSKIVSIITKEYGKISLIAKGVKRSKNSNKGKLQSFLHNKYTIIKKKNLSIITEISTVNSFSNIFFDLEKISQAYQIIWHIYHIAQENQADPALFELTKDTLSKVATDPNIHSQNSLFKFKASLAKLEGLLPKDKKANNINKMLANYIGKDYQAVTL